jgi:hypothetical protein
MKRDPTPSVPSKMSPRAQNMKTGPDALHTAENESGSAKYENGTRRTRHRRKRVREHKTCGTESVGSHFHVLLSRTRFRQCRVRRVPFSCLARPDSLSASPRASNPVFMFSTPGHVFADTEGVWSHFHVLRSRTHFSRYRGRLVPFSSFARLDFFSAEPRASGHVLMF